MLKKFPEYGTILLRQYSAALGRGAGGGGGGSTIFYENVADGVQQRSAREASPIVRGQGPASVSVC